MIKVIGGPVVAKPKFSMNRETLSMQVVSYLDRLIKETALQPGDMIPSEISLAQTLGVSRQVVREAYRSLSALGVVSIESGRNPRIRAMNSSVLAQFFSFGIATEQVLAVQVQELRRAIDLQGVRLAVCNGDKNDFKKMKAAAAAMRSCDATHPEWIRQDIALHVAIADATKNPVFGLVIRALHGLVEESMQVGLHGLKTPEQLKKHSSHHDALVQYICERNEELAVAAMETHFEFARSITMPIQPSSSPAPKQIAKKKRAVKK